MKLYVDVVKIIYCILMGVYLSQPNKDKHITNGQDKRMDFICAEMQGWRKTMEDAAIHKINFDNNNNNSLFAVFDGHGGFEISKYVSNVFVQELMKLKSYQNKDYQIALQEVFKRIDELIESSEGQKQLYKVRYGNDASNDGENQFIGAAVGCTANVLLITQTHIYCANAGDSRSVLSRDGKAVALSEDHKPDSEQEQKRIRKAGGTISMGRVNGGLNLTRSFGDFDYKRNKSLPWSQQMITCKPDVRKFDRIQKKDEFILLGCDGIWQNYVDNNQGIIDLVRKDLKQGIQHKKVVEKLLDNLLAPDTMSGIGCDNMTSVLIVFKN